MFKKVGNGVYVGNFTNVPSRSNDADVTLVISDSDCDTPCFFKYVSHEHTEVIAGTIEFIIGELNDWLVLQEDEWYTGLEILCKEVEQVKEKTYG